MCCQRNADLAFNITANVQDTFTPPNTPSRVRTTSQAPGTPVCCGPAAAVAVMSPRPKALPFKPGTRIELPPIPSPVKVEPSAGGAQRNVVYSAPKSYYLVFHGQGGAQGLFDRWHSTDDAVGIRDICDQYYAHHLFKKFNDYDCAKMYWEEAVETGVTALLKPEPVKGEVFIVLAGIRPGVYTTW